MTHPTPDALQSYVGGAAEVTRRLLVEAHLSLCSDCSILVRQHSDGSQWLPAATTTDEAALPAFERTWHAAETARHAKVCPDIAAVLPGPFSAWLPIPYALRWIPLWPSGARSAVLARDRESGSALYLSHYPRNSEYPQHHHVGLEENVILSGGYQNGDVHVETGDWVIGAPGTEHTPRTGPDEECWCLSRVEAPGVRFHGWREVARRLMFS